MVCCCLMPNILFKFDHKDEVNCGPRSDVISAGTPNREIHPRMRAFVQVGVFASGRGMASGHRVNRSIMVKRYVIPSLGGSGPTKSTWML